MALKLCCRENAVRKEDVLFKLTTYEIYCGTCRRIREILSEAPWSICDFLLGNITFFMGIYLLLNSDLFGQIGGVYAMMSNIASESVWGIVFLGCGGFGLVVNIWCNRPRFEFRLLARMGLAFCMLALAFNHLAYSPRPLSAITYCIFSIAALWGVLRTKASGR